MVNLYLVNSDKMRKRSKKSNIDFQLFSNFKTENGCCIKLFGLKIFEEFSNKQFRIQKFFGNLIYTKKLRSTVREIKVFKIFNFSVSERIITDDIIQYNLFNRTVRKIYYPNIFYKKYLKNVQYDYDDVYILSANSGEIYLFFAYVANAFLKKNGSKNPLFVATKKYHIEILKLYYPQAKYIYINNLKFKAQSDKWMVNGHNIYIIFSNNHFQKVEINIKNNKIGKIHYLNSILVTLNLTKDDYNEAQAYISNQIHESLTSKINEIQLKLNNFIIFAPEALTCLELPESFWIKLAHKLHQKGYDIFVNAMEQKNKIDGCKSIFLSYQEILCLAQKAKAIISLRSGLTEFLLPAKTPNITIYTKFRNRNIRNAFDTDKTIAGFSMLKLPFVSEKEITEINAEEFSDENELLNKVLDSLESILNKEESLV